MAEFQLAVIAVPLVLADSTSPSPANPPVILTVAPEIRSLLPLLTARPLSSVSAYETDWAG